MRIGDVCPLGRYRTGTERRARHPRAVQFLVNGFGEGLHECLCCRIDRHAGYGWNPAIEAMLSTAPTPRSTIPGRAAWVSSMSASALRVTSSRSRCIGSAWNGPLVPKPALLHKPATAVLPIRSINSRVPSFPRGRAA